MLNIMQCGFKHVKLKWFGANQSTQQYNEKYSNILSILKSMVQGSVITSLYLLKSYAWGQVEKYQNIRYCDPLL